jgi:hypothetical protein
VRSVDRLPAYVEIKDAQAPDLDYLTASYACDNLAIEVFEGAIDVFGSQKELISRGSLIYLDIEGARELKRFLKRWLKAHES